MKSGYVALIGRPNVGKSTLMNKLIGQKIAITSKRPQTTRKRIETVYTEKRGQIIFIDAPGITKPDNKLGEYMERSAEKAFKECDIVCWVVEPTDFIGKEEEHILRMIKSQKGNIKPLILVINKLDKLEDRLFLHKVISTYENRCDFDDTVTVSAKSGENLKLLKKAIFKFLCEGPLYYDEETVTLIPMREIAEEFIREQLLKSLRDEIPHGTAVQVTEFSKRRRGLFDIEADIICEKEQHKGIIIGRGGGMLKKIGESARLEIEEELGQKIYLKLFVKVRKNWRKNSLFINSFGYGK